MMYQFSVLPHLAIRSVIGPDPPFLTVGWLQAGESWSSIVHLFALLLYPWIWNSQRLRLFASASPHRMVQSHFYPFTDRALKFQHDNSSISSPLSWNHKKQSAPDHGQLQSTSQTDPDSISFRLSVRFASARK